MMRFHKAPARVGARLLATVVFAAAAAAAHGAEDVPGCGTLKNAYGPFDFRTDKSKLAIVERFHYAGYGPPRSATEYGTGGNLDYTLRAFPNHHVALTALVGLAFSNRKSKVPYDKLVGMNYTIECYLIRAMTFRPDDGVVKMIYALYASKLGKPKQAVQLLEQAKELRPEDANLYYNLGLAYDDLKNYDAALENAHRAYALGFPLPGLRQRLQREGKWRDPAPGEMKAVPADKSAS